MSLLGANIMPHNFYLHSSIVQQDLGPSNVSKGSLCHDHLVAILCIFSGIFLVNYVLMNSAANVFHSTGLVLLTFQDALSLMDQVFWSQIAPFAFLLVLLFSNQITALTWNLGMQAVLHDFFRMEIPSWLHHAIIRIIAIVPALYFVWNSGAEGIYQLLIFTQVMVALVLPSSVIPLFRVASSRSIMGVHKISQFVEFLALISFIGMLSLKIIFVVEMIFGNSDWVSNLRWNLGSSTSILYGVLLVTAFVSFCLMLWLAATPLNSAASRIDAQVRNSNIQNIVHNLYVERDESDLSETRYHGEQPIQKQEPTLGLGKSLESHSDMPATSTGLNLPETLLDSHNVPHFTTIEENSFSVTFPSLSACHPEELPTTVKTVLLSTVCNEVSDSKLQDTGTLKTESMDLVEKTMKLEEYLQTENDDEEDTWEPEEFSKGVSMSSSSLISEGPGSFRSLSGKSDDGGSGAGSLSRLAGLGRAARRQLAAVLDEFWGQLYDFHGQATQGAKAKNLNVMLGVDSNFDPKPAITPKAHTSGNGFTGYPNLGGRGSDCVINSSLYNFPMQQGLQRSIASFYGVQRGSSSLWSGPMQRLDGYVQNPSHNSLDYSERHYYSLRLPPSSDGSDSQPATVHGYQVASLLSRIAKEKQSDYLNGQMNSQTPKSPSLDQSNYRGSLAFAARQKSLTRVSPAKPPGFPDLAASRNSSMQSGRPFYGLNPSGPAENAVSTVDAKKFYSLPDISGLLPHRDSYLLDRNAQRESCIGYNPSVGHTMYDQFSYSSTSSRVGAPLAFDEVSPSKVCRDAFSLQLSSNPDTGSLWSRQPFEQFAVADKAPATGGEGVGSGQSSINRETTSASDLEAKLLQSFRLCIVKLLKLEGSAWLFRQNDGADEVLIDSVAAREKFIHEAETREINRAVRTVEFQFSDRRPGFVPKNDDIDHSQLLVSPVPHCGEGCIWRVNLIISFGVWCIHRVLELSLMESRPELWGKYTYVLNRLQGIIDLAFSKPRSPMTPCFCLKIPLTQQQRLSPPSNAPVKQSRGKCTTAAMLLDIIKDVESAISGRKGRTGTAAGDVAFPKGKENLASVLKRYKRRLANKSG
ncbi:ethylene-insensitive protein 2.2-like isoform X2 [Cornus florida]|nr:ethylene-insensitive protein 2.2-like isoform X2 [Cornus florida]